MLGLIVLLQTLTIAVSGPLASPEYLPLHVAQAEGLFRREGLDVTLRPTRAEPDAAEALAQGQADLAATSLPSMLRHGPRTEAQAARLVFGLTAAPPVALVVPAAHAGAVRTIADLAGTQVGVTSPGAPEYPWLGRLLARAGLSVADLSIVSHGTRGLGRVMDTGEVHAGLVGEPLASRLLAREPARLLADLRTPAGVKRALGTLTVNAAVFARADRMPPDADLAALARALMAAERRLEADAADDLAVRLGPGVTGLPETFDAQRLALRGMYLAGGRVDVDQVRATLALVRAYVPLPATQHVPDADELLHPGSRETVITPTPGR